MFFKYTRFLEKENEELKAKISELETQLRGHHVDKKHLISLEESKAACSCGWMYNSEDPGKLQTAITTHYRSATVSRGRKSWPQVKQALEKTTYDN